MRQRTVRQALLPAGRRQPLRATAGLSAANQRPPDAAQCPDRRDRAQLRLRLRRRRHEPELDDRAALARPDTVLGKSIPSTTLSQDLAGSGQGGCVDLTTEIGITGTPAIALTKDTAPKEGRHLRGRQVPGRPGTTTRSSFTFEPLRWQAGRQPCPDRGTGNGRRGESGGKIVFAPMIQHQRPLSSCTHDSLYIASAATATGPFHGWLFAYDVSDPKAPEELDVFCTTPNINRPGKRRGGWIWMSGQGRRRRPGNIYFSAGRRQL